MVLVKRTKTKEGNHHQGMVSNIYLYGNIILKPVVFILGAGLSSDTEYLFIMLNCVFLILDFSEILICCGRLRW